MLRTSPTSGCCRKTFSSASAARTWPVPALAERIRTRRPLGLGEGWTFRTFALCLVRRNRFLKSVMPLAKELSLYFALGRSTVGKIEDFAAGGEEKFYRKPAGR